jgi:hypothetical protein
MEMMIIYPFIPTECSLAIYESFYVINQPDRKKVICMPQRAIVAPKATLIWEKGGLGGRGILWQRPSNNIEIV